MYNRLLKFIDKNYVLNEFQFGFRNNHSTFMALIVLMENLVTALDSGDCAIGLFLDFQKAFDIVDHYILLDKLLSYGVRGIAHAWSNSYLSNRLQSVNYNGQESNFKLMKCGVAQGSILGPLLFLIYINDLPNVTIFMPILFADDTNLFDAGPNLSDLVCQINQEIKTIYSWVKANKLSLNIDKTIFMLFTIKGFSRVLDELQIEGNRIMEVHETKFFGVIIDNKLSWRPHKIYICTKVGKGIGVILKARKVFDHETLLTLYYTFVYPYLHFCIHVWGRAYDTHLNDFRVLQNKIVRIINGVPPRTNTDYLYSQKRILSVNRLYYYNIGIFMYKYSNNMHPGIFSNLFHKIEDSHSYCARQSTAKHQYVNFRSTTRGQRSCIYSSSIIWNFILDNFDPDCAIGSFKRQYQALFLTSQVDLFKQNLLLINNTTAHLEIIFYCLMVNMLPWTPGTKLFLSSFWDC